MIDIILTRTQRKTPTVIHPGYKISRIRAFYMRKVKFTEQTVSEKLGNILHEFPRLDDVHPFYGDLMNILYDRDHFKLALGQVNTAKNLIAGISKDYVRLMKYGDSLYRCKQLKRAALGRMCTLIKKLRAALGYLEEVRKHISRLPALDPSTRTLLLTGYPNVGKSSFMNKVTRADVEVQPYAFTTKALFVGHMDHRYLRWQVVDTPGILDRPLEERNTIEMQAITALAHLQCCVLYFLDISEQCGYPLEQQLQLFESIRPLFVNKEVMLVANKTDVTPYEELPSNKRAMIEEAAGRASAQVIPMSNVSEENVSQLKITACDKLLEARVDAKLTAGKLRGDVMARVTVVQPKPRDGVVREVSIPESVRTKGAPSAAAAARSSTAMDVESRTTEKDRMIANGGAGVYVCDYKKYYLMEEDEWRYDAMPEFMDGKNVIDFFDADIEARLVALEEEEAALEAQGAYAAANASDDDDLDEEEVKLHRVIKEVQAVAREESRLKRSNLPAKLRLKSTTPVGGAGKGTDNDDSGGGDGVDDMDVLKEAEGARKRGRQPQQRGRKRSRDSDSASVNGGRDDAMDVTELGSRGRSQSVVREAAKRRRGASTTRGSTEASVAPSQRKQVGKSKRTLERHLVRHARAGEADRRHYPKLIKHLNSGKSSLGTSTIGR